MRKRWFLVGAILFLLSWLLVGCGVAQEQYDAVVADLGKEQQELQSVKAELEAAQAKVSQLTASLENSQTELKATQAENSELTSNLEKAQTELEASKDENSELKASLETTKSELAGIKSENEDLEQEIDKLKRLDIGRFVLCSKQPMGPDNYVPQPENAYEASSTVYVLCTFYGYKMLFSEDEGFNRDYNVSLVIKDTEGKTAASREESFTKPLPTPMGGHWQWWSFTRLEPNNYTVEVEVTDFYSGETVTQKEEFTVGQTQEGKTT